jgi:hypothetical protein
MSSRLLITGLATAMLASAKAEPPVAVFAFPAGGQRGTEVPLRIGGMFFHGEASFSIDGAGVKAGSEIIKEMPRLWFEGPLIHQPQSQRPEDYPRDHASKIVIEKDAAPGPRRWHCRTSQGVTASLPFIVGDLPEIVEAEQDGQAVPVSVKAPLTINGRVFPRQDRDVWEIEAAAGEWISGEVVARRLGNPLEPDLQVSTEHGDPVKFDKTVIGGDPRFSFHAPKAGRYRVEIGDGNYSGGPHYIYRLTLRHGPVPVAVYPMGGKRGAQTALESTGPGLEKPVAQTATLPATGDWHAVSDGNGAHFLLPLGDDPEILESPSGGGTLTLPGVANGRILKPGEQDDWTATLTKGQSLELEVFAARLGSRLDARLTILDAEDKELAANDDAAPNQPDSRLVFTAPADGAYRVRLADRFTSRAGHDFGYRLHSRLAGDADFRLVLGGESLNLARAPEPNGEPEPPAVDAKGKPLKKPRPRGSGIVVNLEPVGAFKSDVMLEIEGLPEGVTLDDTSAKLAFAKKTTELFFDATPATLIQNREIKVRGTAEIDGQKVTREATLPFRFGEPAGSSIRFAVTPAVPFSFIGEYWVETGYPIGSRLTKSFRLERGGHTGPLLVEMSDRQIRHLQGVTAAAATLAPDVADRFSYTVTLPPRMEFGRTSRVQLMISGEIVDHDGRKHRVSYTNAQPEQQMMSIVSEGRISLTTESLTVRATPGATVRLPVIVKRDRSLVELPIRLVAQIPATATDLAIAPIDLSPGQEKAEIEFRFGAQPGPFLESVKLRAATVTDDPKLQHEAEIELEMVPVGSLTASAKP